MLYYFLRLFGAGRLPEEARRMVEANRSALVAESLVGSITYRRYRSLGRYFGWRRTWFLGALVATDRELFAYRYRRRIVAVPLDDPRMKHVRLSLVRPDRLSMLIDSSAMPDASWSGQVEVQYTTPLAHQFQTHITHASRH